MQEKILTNNSWSRPQSISERTKTTSETWLFYECELRCQGTIQRRATTLVHCLCVSPVNRAPPGPQRKDNGHGRSHLSLHTMYPAIIFQELVELVYWNRMQGERFVLDNDQIHFRWQIRNIVQSWHRYNPPCWQPTPRGFNGNIYVIGTIYNDASE